MKSLKTIINEINVRGAYQTGGIVGASQALHTNMKKRGIIGGLVGGSAAIHNVRDEAILASETSLKQQEKAKTLDALRAAENKTNTLERHIGRLEKLLKKHSK